MNFNPEDKDEKKLLRIADSLGITAWIGDHIGGMEGNKGFYVFYKVRDLTQFWEAYNG